MANPFEIRRPRSDDRPLLDIFFALEGSIAVFAAHKLGLFESLGTRALNLSEVCDALKLAPRPAEALLSISAAAGFVKLDNGRYRLTAVAEDYLLESSPTYFGSHWRNLVASVESLHSISSVVRAAQTDSQQVYGGGDWTRSHEEQAELARAFTRAMHSTSMAAALAWPEKIDLSMYRAMLDIGGGSGAHCIGAVSRWLKLNATVFDLAPVCEVAREIASQYQLAERISTHVGDLWKGNFPAADLHFYGMIFHDWPPAKCRFLAEKSFAALPKGGRIIIHEMLFNDDRTGPWPVAAMNITMLLWCEGQQYSGGQLSDMLRQAGFDDIEVVPSFGYWSIVTGVKP